MKTLRLFFYIVLPQPIPSASFWIRQPEHLYLFSSPFLNIHSESWWEADLFFLVLFRFTLIANVNLILNGKYIWWKAAGSSLRLASMMGFFTVHAKMYLPYPSLPLGQGLSHLQISRRCGGMCHDSGWAVRPSVRLIPASASRSGSPHLALHAGTAWRKNPRAGTRLFGTSGTAGHSMSRRWQDSIVINSPHMFFLLFSFLSDVCVGPFFSLFLLSSLSFPYSFWSSQWAVSAG